MILVTQQQRDNAIEARDVMWPSVPLQNVAKKLAFWRSDANDHPAQTPHTCKTLACFGGWCTAWQPFQAQGLKAYPNGAPRNGSKSLYCEMPSEFLFGTKDYVTDMFATRGQHLVDDKSSAKTTDHEIVTRRLKWLIKNTQVKVEAKTS